MEKIRPELGPITRTNGVAGAYAYSVDVTYPDEPTMRVHFYGSAYGGSVVSEVNGAQVFVRRPERFGEKLSPEWVRRFFECSQ